MLRKRGSRDLTRGSFGVEKRDGIWRMLWCSSNVKRHAPVAFVFLHDLLNMSNRRRLFDEILVRFSHRNDFASCFRRFLWYSRTYQCSSVVNPFWVACRSFSIAAQQKSLNQEREREWEIDTELFLGWLLRKSCVWTSCLLPLFESFIYRS